ncbi:MAG: outer membrane beta-barrel protein [Crocinitomicaceae bacterium]|nr:outer membrane beta-barrel protein [Crocinitomicaceae bacterium]
MKYIMLILSFTSLSSFSQTNFYLGGSASYLLNGKIQFKEGLVDVGDKLGADASFGFITDNNFGFELNYSGAYNCDLEFRSYSFTGHEDFFTSVDIHSISVNYLQYFENDTPFTPFISVGTGTSVFDIKKDDVDDAVRFALNFGGGTTIEINRFISARIRARYFAPLIFKGSGIHAGISTGGTYLGLSIDASAPLAQLNLDAGFIFKLN